MMEGLIQSPFWMVVAKLLLALIMVGSGVICLYVLSRSHQWRESLALMEAECNYVRDEAMMQATVARSQLAEIQERLKKKPEKAEAEVIGTLVREAVPILTFLMQRETNVLKWGFAGAKLIRTAYEYFSSRK